MFTEMSVGNFVLHSFKINTMFDFQPKQRMEFKEGKAVDIPK